MLHKLLSVFAFFPILSKANITVLPVEIFPKQLSNECRDGLAQIYDECSDQVDILEQARITANNQNKRVLLVYGAEWCIWDHVFNKYIQGGIAGFNYQWRANEGDFVQWKMKEKVTKSDYKDAEALNHFVSNNFVVVNIESNYANGKDVLEKVGYLDDIYYIPTIMVLNENGRFIEKLPPTSSIDGLQIRESNGEEYRGYNRKILLNKLPELRNLAD